MTANTTYLRTASLLIAVTLIVLAIVIAGASYVASTTTLSAGYYTSTGLGLLSLLISLFIGCFSFIKSLCLLDCDQWNIRMVILPSIAQVVLLCAGMLVIALSVFLI